VSDNAALHNSQFTIHNSQFHQDDLLWRQLKTIPAFRAVLRAVEARFYTAVDLPAPVLDVGCGDGHFSQMTFGERIRAGIDPWWNPLQKAHDSGMYEVLAQAMGDRLPFADATFASAFSNSVLEHIPDIQPVLNEVNRVLKEDGRFLITLPSHYFTEWLGGAALFEKVGAKGAADWYRQRFNGISRHAHTDPPEVWAARLAGAGFAIERWQYYFSQEALRALEMGHAQGIPSAVMHALTGHWIVAPWESSLKWTERWLRPYYDEPFGDRGAYLLIIARKKADGPIEAVLPGARPFTIEELNGKSLMVNGKWLMGDAPPSADAVPNDPMTQLPITNPPESPISDLPISQSPNLQSPNPVRLPALLISLSLLFALFGQAALGSSAGGSVSGLGWLVLAAVPLAILAWWSRPSRDGAGWQWPRLGSIPERRWLFVPALLLTVLASRLTAVPGNERPTLALLLWFIALALGFFALRNYELGIMNYELPIADTRSTLYALRTTLIIAILLFLTAVLLRTYQLSQQPFVLSGIEASLGLNAVEILNGQIRNPFGTAWLTNPTLLLYLTAVPIHFFGQTVLALRFLSPIVGGLTVVAMFVIGQRLYGRAVGLVAAILLLGSHLHLQYSRLGMSNVWGPLLILLALGLVAIAWERNKNAPRQRMLWLCTGIAIGLNVYEFTAVRLLPIILLLLLVWALLLDRKTLRAQGAHLLAALALATLVALPAILFYRNNPTIFMERANVLGIFDEQTGWLRQQASATGQSQLDLFQQQFWRAALAFNGGTDLSPTYRPNAPLLSFGTAVLLILGFFIALFRFRQLKYAMLIIWLLATILFAGAFLIDPPQSHRLLIALPAVLLLAALALAEIMALWQGEQGSRWKGEQVIEDHPLTPSPPHPTTSSPHHLIILITLAVLLTLSELFFYFGRYPTSHEFADANTEAAYEISQYLNSLDGDWTAYLYGPPFLYADFPTFPYLLTNFHKGVNFFEVSQLLPTVSTPAPNEVFIFVPERAGEVTAVQEEYPGGELVSVDGRYRSPLFLVYTIK
jgi:SAM-dependent methyltransferase